MTLTAAINSSVRRVPNWLAYIVCALPAPWLLYLAATGGLGVEPIEALEHRLGELALQFLVAGLAVTPLRRHLGLNLMKFRRMLGLITFYYVVLHLAVWLFLDVQIAEQIWKDIVKRPYVTLGMAGFVLLIPLAVTSNAWSVRKLGPAWHQLHKLVYPAALLGALHFVWLAKGFQIEPLIYLMLVIALLVLRMPWVSGMRRRVHPPVPDQS